MALRLRLPALGWPALLLAGAAVFGMLAGTRPQFALAAAIALGFVSVVMADLTLGLCAFTLLAFVDVIPGGPAFSVTKLIGMLLALSWLATIATRSDSRADFFSEHPGAVYLLGVFAAWTGISALWATDAGEALTSASRFGLNFLLFPIVFTALRQKRHVTWLAWTFVGGALLSAAFGFVVPQPTEEGRLAGAVGEANELASVLVAAFAVAVGIAIATTRSPAMRTAALAAAALCVGGVFYSLSRSGLLALMLVALAGVLVAGRWRGRAAVAALLVAAVGVVWFTSFATPQVRDRITRVEGGAGRVDLWRIGWRMAEQEPLLGVGAGNFQTSSPRFLLEPGALVRDDFVLDRPKQTHNIYLQTLAELGIPGLLLLLAIIAFSIACAARAARLFREQGDVRLEVLTWAFLVATVGVLATDFFQSEQYSKQLWLLLALGPALLGLARRTSGQSGEPARP